MKTLGFLVWAGLGAGQKCRGARICTVRARPVGVGTVLSYAGTVPSALEYPRGGFRVGPQGTARSCSLRGLGGSCGLGALARGVPREGGSITLGGSLSAFRPRAIRLRFFRIQFLEYSCGKRAFYWIRFFRIQARNSWYHSEIHRTPKIIKISQGIGA